MAESSPRSGLGPGPADTGGAASGRRVRGGVMRAALASLTPAVIVTTLALATVVALILSPFFAPSFLELAGRALVISTLCLLAWALAGQWRGAWPPRWVLQIGAVVAMAPLATVLVYLAMVERNVLELMRNEHALHGIWMLATVAITVGVAAAVGAREREHRALERSRALQFALRNESLERQALDARVRLLQAQIEPHFLFNTLANVQALVESGSPRAGPVLDSLIRYLRAATPHLRADHATLGEEIVLVRAYLDLMQMRMPDRLAWRVESPADLASAPMMPTTLLTLVENAIAHGIDPSEEGGRVEVCVRRLDDGRLAALVADSGVGIAPGTADGLGLANLRERLAVEYGGRASLTVGPAIPGGARAELIWPDTRALDGPR
jgi:signal transduction histidine kinase